MHIHRPQEGKKNALPKENAPLSPLLQGAEDA